MNFLRIGFDKVHPLRFDLLDQFRIDIAQDDARRQKDQEFGPGNLRAIVAKRLANKR